MAQLLDDKCRCLLSALRNQYVNALQLEDYLAQYRLLRSNLEKEKNDMSHELLQNVNNVEEHRCISIPVATYSTDVLPLTVRFLDGKSFSMLCPNFYKLSDLRPLLAKHASNFDPKDILLGFSQDFDGEVIFLDENLPVEKLCGKTKSVDTTLLVKFYMPDVLLLDNALSRHQLYLQLRRDLSSSDRLYLAAQERIQAAAFAILAEDVDRACLSVDSNKLSSLVGWRVVEQFGSTEADSLLRAEVAKLDPDLPKDVAELEFCKIVQSNENYGKRYYRVYPNKDFEVQLSSLYVSLSVFGITVEESAPTISADVPPTVIIHSFPWRQVSAIKFTWHRLTIGIKQSQGPLSHDSKSKSGTWVQHYYIRKKAVGNYLLRLAADLNQFQMSLLQTYRIDRIIFPRSSGGPFDTCRSATLPRHDVEVMAIDHFSSTMPRKHCSSGLSATLDTSGQTSPIFAFGNSNNSGRASAPPSSTNNLLISSMVNLSEQPVQLLTQQPMPKQQLLPQLKSDTRIGLFKNQASSKWMSLSDFRQNNKNESNKSNETELAEYVKSVISNENGGTMQVEQADIVTTQFQSEQSETEEVIYDFAASLVPVDKVVQGMPPPDLKSQLFQVVLQRDSGGSIGFTLSLDSTTRHLVVRKVRPGGAAEKSGQIALGDRLVQIGDYNLSGKDYEDCVSLLRSISFPVKLTFERPVEESNNDAGSTEPSTSSPSEPCDRPTEDGTEAFDKLSYSHPNDEVVPEEFILQPSYAVDHVFDEASVTSYHQAPMVMQTNLGDTLDGVFLAENAIQQIEFEQSQNLVNHEESVVHEEMAYPSATYTDDENPYAYAGEEDIDEGLIEKMLDALGEDEQAALNDEPTFQLDVPKLDEERGFGFNVSFSSGGRCTVNYVDQEQAETSGLAVGDVLVAVNGQQFDECSLSVFLQTENVLRLTLLACVDIKSQKKLQNQNEKVSYDFRLPSNSSKATMPQQLTTVSEIIKISVTKQAFEELGCSLFACGSEIFIGTVKPGSKLASCGVLPGDMCLLINNESVFGMPSEKVASALRSAAGQVTITLSRRKLPQNQQNVAVPVGEENVSDRFNEVAANLGKQLSPAQRADLRRLAANWHQRDIDNHDAEFTQISSRLGPVDSAVTRPSSCEDLDTVLLELNTCTFILSLVPNHRSFGHFWQLISDCNVQAMVILGDLPHAFFPLQCDEVLKVNLPAASYLSLSVRLLSSSCEVENLTFSKFALTKSNEERMFYLIQYAQQSEVFSPSLVDALILPHALSSSENASSSRPVLVCSDLASSSFDQRGVFCVVSSLLSLLLKSATVITASSIGDSAAQLRRQHPDSLKFVEHLALIYSTTASSIDRIVEEDALSY